LAVRPASLYGVDNNLLLNYEFGIKKEAVLAKVGNQPEICLEKVMKTTKNIFQDS
jgi:hypothetical protein